MIMPRFAPLALTALVLLLPAVAAGKHTIRASVDPRVELLSIIFRLAGNPEYNQPNSKSPYADEVAADLGESRDQPSGSRPRALPA
jgi:hypothetical protein